MKTFFSHSLSQSLIQQIGLTLIYSLGLGILLAVFAAITLSCTKNVKASVRYNLLSGLLFLFAFATLLTLIRGMSWGIDERTGGISAGALRLETMSETKPVPSFSRDYLRSFWLFILSQAQTITILWFAVVALKSFKMGRGLYQIYYIKRHNTFSIGAYWERKVEDFAGRIGVFQSVGIMQSAIVKIPLVMGHFKPVILIPLGAIIDIPAEQIEMIILHELAHVKRRDFLVNLAQQLLELIFFFNPAVLWVSYLIRKEREHCCDDIALEFSGNKKTYINALLSFRQFEATNSVYAIAFAENSTLLERVRRLVSQKNTPLRPSEKVFFGLAFILLFVFSMLIAQVSEKRSSSDGVIYKPKVVVSQHFPQPLRPVQPAKKSINLSSKSYEGHVMGEKNDASSTDKKAAQQRKTAFLMNLYNQANADTLRPLKRQEPIKLDQLRYVAEPLNVKLSGLSDTLSSYWKPNTYDNRYNRFEKPEYEGYVAFKRFETANFKLRKGFGNEVLDEIENAGVKYDRNWVKVHISNEELVVDGVRQSREIHEKVLAKFVRKPGDRIDFTFEKNQN